MFAATEAPRDFDTIEDARSPSAARRELVRWSSARRGERTVENPHGACRRRLIQSPTILNPVP